MLGLLGAAQARTVAVGGVAQAPAVDSRQLAGGEALAVWTLPRLGVSVRNDPRDLRLLYGARELRYAPGGSGQGGGWRAVGLRVPAGLAAPQSVNGSLYVPLAALRALGVRVLSEAPDVLDFAAPALVPAATLPPSPDLATATATAATPAPSASPAPARPSTPAPVTAAPAPTSAPASPAPGSSPVTAAPAAATTLSTVRIGRELHRNVEVQRVVLELSAAAAYTVTRDRSGLSLTLAGVAATPVHQTLNSGDTLSVTPGSGGVAVRLNTGGGSSEVFTLDNPARVVIDTTTQLDTRVPPPIDPEALPPGVTYRNKGYLHLLSFDPALYQPRVVSAPAGRALGLSALVGSVRGVAGVNGGYFDPATALPVDLVVSGGLMTAPSLEKRATVGFTATGATLVGYPRPRYVLSGPFGSVTVNTVGPRARADLLTAFVGDGRTAVGADSLTTLYVVPGAGTVASALSGRVTPPAGTLALTFDPSRYPQLPRAAGATLNAALAWRAEDAPWDSAQDALSAGPLLVQGGQVALNPAREQFNTSAGIWRATRQVALGTLNGQPTIAYFEHGTPEAFAAALAASGVRDAVRMDSGSSAAAYVAGGYGNLGGYLNTVWGQNVPNAVVFVPRAAATAQAGKAP
ncbi:phosphodiester glycosidase family protein [uncultured Deinococcus sp.]|uniref:phosphodiester glycosidase family protein n=1 Tax=uncultured Deinococcus sp. TaxID=158789 RepID=UPI00258C78F2|nr:phosphodiester glycosidase family protein [uncultured Deinococcus sp.]